MGRRKMITEVLNLEEPTESVGSPAKVLTEVETLKLENHLLKIGNQRMQEDNLNLQIVNKNLVIENGTVRLEKIKIEQKLIEEQKNNVKRMLNGSNTEYEVYKKMLEEKYKLGRKWAYNPDTFEIIEN